MDYSEEVIGRHNGFSWGNLLLFQTRWWKWSHTFKLTISKFCCHLWASNLCLFSLLQLEHYLIL
jgi:hypothetical protein